MHFWGRRDRGGEYHDNNNDDDAKYILSCFIILSGFFDGAFNYFLYI